MYYYLVPGGGWRRERRRRRQGRRRWSARGTRGSTSKTSDLVADAVGKKRQRREFCRRRQTAKLFHPSGSNESARYSPPQSPTRNCFGGSPPPTTAFCSDVSLTAVADSAARNHSTNETSCCPTGWDSCSTNCWHRPMGQSAFSTAECRWRSWTLRLPTRRSEPGLPEPLAQLPSRPRLAERLAPRRTQLVSTTTTLLLLDDFVYGLLPVGIRQQMLYSR